jgi:hypothetical protein
MHDLQKSIHLMYRPPMHVDELRMLDDTPVAASMASSWSVLVLGVSEKHSQQSFAGVVENQDALPYSVVRQPFPCVRASSASKTSFLRYPGVVVW